MRTLLIVVSVFLLAASPTPTVVWPTPTSAASPFVGVTPAPTPVVLPTAFICFQVNTSPLVCGRDINIAAGSTVGVGISIGRELVNGIPSGPWPATVSWTVNTVNYPTTPVNQTNGLIGFATVPGIQQLTVSVAGTATFNGSTQLVTTH